MTPHPAGRRARLGGAAGLSGGAAGRVGPAGRVGGASRAPVAAALAAVLGLGLTAACSAGSPGAAARVSGQQRPAPAAPPARPSPLRASSERDRPGNPDWRVVNLGSQHDIEGFTDADSVLPGTRVRLYVSTVAAHYRVLVYRMGWYGGARAGLVWRSGLLPGSLQPPAEVVGLTHTPSAPWRPSLVLDTGGWLPGDYLLRLDTDRGALRRFVPLTVRNPSMRGAVVLVNADTTWQAYNAWGGYSLYHGPTGQRADRARAVTFDRPYAYGGGAGDFVGAELPVLALAERLGLPLGYATDVDLQRDPHLLDGARGVISLGHDEYWSPVMRSAVTAARDRGTNVAFLGANALYRKIRFGSTPLGPYRLEINYKTAADPIRATDPAAVTTQWRESPSNDPESSLTGAFYRCNPVRAPMVVVDPTHWLFAGLGLRWGDALPRVVGSEYDGVDLQVPTPRPIEVLTHSPVFCGGYGDYADAAYYTTASGAAGFDAGTSDWITSLDSANPRVAQVVTAATSRLLQAYAAGPAGRSHPARDTAPAYRGTGNPGVGGD